MINNDQLTKLYKLTDKTGVNRKRVILKLDLQDTVNASISTSYLYIHIYLKGVDLKQTSFL
jgi:hypothetical protein